MNGLTRESESLASKQSVTMYWMTRATSIQIRGDTQVLNETIIMTVDKDSSNARSEFDQAIDIIERSGGHYTLLKEHTDAWANIWNQGRVEVDDDRLGKVVNFAQFYLLGNLPPIDPWRPTAHNEIFFGTARGSLAKGDIGKNYQVSRLSLVPLKLKRHIYHFAKWKINPLNSRELFFLHFLNVLFIQ